METLLNICLFFFPRRTCGNYIRGIITYLKIIFSYPFLRRQLSRKQIVHRWHWEEYVSISCQILVALPVRGSLILASFMCPTVGGLYVPLPLVMWLTLANQVFLEKPHAPSEQKSEVPSCVFCSFISSVRMDSPSKGCPCSLDTGWRKDWNEDKTQRTGSWPRGATAKMWAGDKHPGSKLLRSDGPYRHSISWWKLRWICWMWKAAWFSLLLVTWLFGLNTHRIFFFTFEIQKHYYDTSSF